MGTHSDIKVSISDDLFPNGLPGGRYVSSAGKACDKRQSAGAGYVSTEHQVCSGVFCDWP